jgi:leukotriene-A4 hydrolase
MLFFERDIYIHIPRTEQKLGGLDVFLPYIKNYVSTFTGQSITSNQWKEHLFEYFNKHGSHDEVTALNSIDFDVEYTLPLGPMI